MQVLLMWGTLRVLLCLCSISET